LSKSNASDPDDPEQSLVPVNGGRTGPRTTEGKAVSKLNATTHGIFSNVVVLKTESRTDYESLLKGVREACKPLGMLEEVLVDKLTTILWRYRRLITAESGEISENLSSTDRIDAQIRGRYKLQEEYVQKSLTVGMIEMAYDPDVLKVSMTALSNLRDNIKRHGFRKDLDRRILGRKWASILLLAWVSLLGV
jgi:hypothetical protein